VASAQKYTCIGCPIGCPLQLVHEGDEIMEISGYECNRGAKYAKQEFTDPRRELSTTVEITGARWKRLPVKVTGPVEKGRVLEAARQIHQLKIKAPVKLGQVLIKDFFGEKGIDVIACRSMEQLSNSPH
jgi:CxxC motif-containing protein